MTKKEIEVLEFLAEFKYLLSHGKFYLIRDRKNNIETLLELGITENQRNDYLFNLTKEDYSEGPTKDRKRGGDIWIFGKIIDSKEIYIKLAINIYNGKQAVCISFHIAERPLKYPYQK